MAEEKTIFYYFINKVKISVTFWSITFLLCKPATNGKDFNGYKSY